MGRVAQGLAGAASVAAVLCLLVVLSAPVAHEVPDNLAHCNNGTCLQHPSPGLRFAHRTRCAIVCSVKDACGVCSLTYGDPVGAD